MALSQKLVHVRPAYIFFPVAVACNAILWISCSAVWRMLRRQRQTTFDRYRIALAATCLVFVIANTVHFLRRVTCYDCFFRYGVPFTLYRDGGFAGGGGLVLRGFIADAATIIVCSVFLGGLWQWFEGSRVEQ